MELESVQRLPRVTLRKDLRRALRRGHPWVYRDALDEAKVSDGAVVLVLGHDGRPLGRGYFSASGAIAVRMLTTDRNDALPGLVAARLATALSRRLELLRSGETNAFRWVHGEADLLPGVHVDVYARFASVLFDGPGARAFYLGNGLPAALVAGATPPVDAVIERGRRRENDESGPAALVGRVPQGEIEVLENGLRFGVDLLRGQKGGLFLDQRENRARVRDLARGRRVLNLFGYTGGFSLYAAAGGALSTTTVDEAAPAIEAARHNFARNAGSLDAAAAPPELVVADAFEFLAAARARNARWDLVVSDPPSFAPSARALERALAAYARLHALCAAVTAPGGRLCAASCSSHVPERDFLASVEAGCRAAGVRFVLDGVYGAALDHPVRQEFVEGRYLKFAVGRVEQR